MQCYLTANDLKFIYSSPGKIEFAHVHIKIGINNIHFNQTLLMKKKIHCMVTEDCIFSL
jgi:hypothetical protein